MELDPDLISLRAIALKMQKGSIICQEVSNSHQDMDVGRM